MLVDVLVHSRIRRHALRGFLGREVSMGDDGDTLRCDTLVRGSSQLDTTLFGRRREEGDGPGPMRDALACEIDSRGAGRPLLAPCEPRRTVGWTAGAVAIFPVFVGCKEKAKPVVPSWRRARLDDDPLRVKAA